MLDRIRNSFKRCFQSPKKWNLRFETVHGRDLEQSWGNNKLRLILGNGRSGTSWLARILSQTESPIRYCHEILSYVKPFYYFSPKNDYTSCPYRSELNDDDPLLKIYLLTTSSDLEWHSFLGDRYIRQVRREDDGFSFVLHKEVHALLATEGLVKKLKCPTVVITRNPIYNIDSLLSYQDCSSIIWRNESRYVMDVDFLNNYFQDTGDRIIEQLSTHPDDGINRKNVIVSKTLTVAVINQMLCQLSKKSKFIKHVRYEDMCEDPFVNFQKCADFLDLHFDDGVKSLLSETMRKKDNNSFDPMSVHRNTKSQKNRSFRVLSEDEVRYIRSVLDYCRLM